MQAGAFQIFKDDTCLLRRPSPDRCHSYLTPRPLHGLGPRSERRSCKCSRHTAAHGIRRAPAHLGSVLDFAQTFTNWRVLLSCMSVRKRAAAALSLTESRPARRCTSQISRSSWWLRMRWMKNTCRHDSLCATARQLRAVLPGRDSNQRPGLSAGTLSDPQQHTELDRVGDGWRRGPYKGRGEVL